MATWTPHPFRRLSGASRRVRELLRSKRSGFAWTSPPHTTTAPVHSDGGCFLSRPPFACPEHGCRNLLPARHRLRPLTLRDLGLGSDSPWDVCRCPGTLRLPVWRVLTPPFTLLIPAFSLVGAPSGPSGPPSPLPTTLPYHVPTTPSLAADGGTSAASGRCLSPVTLSAQGHSTSELLRTLSRMAASKPTSWLSRPPHYLVHSADTLGP